MPDTNLPFTWFTDLNVFPLQRIRSACLVNNYSFSHFCLD